MKKKLSGPALLAGAIIAWAVLLWFFTINNPSFVPVAKLIFIVLVIPLAAAEWIKIKGFVSAEKLFFVKISLILAGAALWYFKLR